VRDGIRHHGGSTNTVTVNKDMLQRARASYARYKDYLSKKKQKNRKLRRGKEETTRT